MSKIDWSKVPEGATHWNNANNSFYKNDGIRSQIYHYAISEWEDSLYKSTELERYPFIQLSDFQPFTSIEGAQPEGRKLDGGKVIMGAIPPDAELAVARVLTFGAEKYARDNWRKVPDMDVRYMDAALRHLNAYRRGEPADHESGESHLAHAACCIMFLLQIEEESK